MRLLSHPSRAAIVAYVARLRNEALPDATELAAALGMTAAEAEYHLTVLSDAGLLGPTPEGPIAPESKAFLAETLGDLRDDLLEQMRAQGPGSPEPEKAARELATYEALLGGLAGDGELPDDEFVRHFVGELARAADDGNAYEQTILEHRAFRELIRALADTDGE